MTAGPSNSCHCPSIKKLDKIYNGQTCIEQFTTIRGVEELGDRIAELYQLIARLKNGESRRNWVTGAISSYHPLPVKQTSGKKLYILTPDNWIDCLCVGI